MNILAKLLSLLFPPHCVMCGDITTDFSDYCGCTLPLNNKVSCPLCNSSEKHCRCNKSFVFTSSPFFYSGNVKKAILLLKQTPDKRTLSFFSGYMEKLYTENYQNLNIDIIVPVPMSKTAKKKRRFNQAELLASFLGENISLEVNSKLILRKDSSIQQHSLNKKQRFENALSSYIPVAKAVGVSYKSILLVDDICTTGATLEACSRALKENGAKNIYCITAVSTPFYKY